MAGLYCLLIKNNRAIYYVLLMICLHGIYNLMA